MTRLFIMALTGALLIGCSTTRGQRPVASEPTTVRLEPGIYDVATGQRLDEDALYKRLSDARYVLVGESHDNPCDHQIQAKVFRALVERSDAPVALGMEMFQRPFQPALDAYVAGESDEEQMLRDAQWEKRWGFATELYRPLWEAARESEQPLVALNIRRELTKRVSKVGVEGLTPTEREDLPELDLTDEAYRAWVRDVFAQHGAEMSEEKFERFFQAQVLWDEAMADTAVEFMRSHPKVDKMVIVAGRGHVERDFGIPPRIRRRIGATPADGAVVSIIPTDPDVPPLQALKREAFGDYIWVRACEATSSAN